VNQPESFISAGLSSWIHAPVINKAGIEVLLGAISDEDVKFQIYEQFIEIDALQKSKNSTAESKKAAKEKAGKTVIGLAKALSEKLKKEAAPAGQDASQGGTVPPSETNQS